MNLPHWAENLLTIEAAVLTMIVAISAPFVFCFLLWESWKLYRDGRKRSRR
jgi:TRAP-type uncharacterized transport system fused permease subunit